MARAAYYLRRESLSRLKTHHPTRTTCWWFILFLNLDSQIVFRLLFLKVLHAAICVGNHSLVSKLIIRHEQLGKEGDTSGWKELSNKIGCTPLWLSMAYGHLDIFRQLAAADCELDTTNGTGDSVLLAASWCVMLFLILDSQIVFRLLFLKVRMFQKSY